jgi:hypothetical protein
MSKYNGVGKLYDRFTPEERFQLEVEAAARGDEEEIRRLVKSCPKYNYRMPDVRFMGRWNESITLTMGELAYLRPTIAYLRLLDVFRGITERLSTIAGNEASTSYYQGHREGSHYAWKRAGMDGDPPGYEQDEDLAEQNQDPVLYEAMDYAERRVEVDERVRTEYTDRLERELATIGLSNWQAFTDFCKEQFDVDAKKLVQAFAPPAVADIELLEEICNRLEIEPDTTAVAEHRAMLQEGWDDRVAKGLA